MSLRSRFLLTPVVAGLAWASVASAQGSSVYKLPLPAAIGAETGRAQPGVTASSPIGFGPSAGSYFAGVGYQNATRYGGDADGSVSVGAGFFDARRLGLEVVVTSASTVRSGFGDRMYGSLKAHRVTASGVGVGFGIEGMSLSGEAATDPSVYAAVTKVQRIGTGARFNQVTWNGGIGTTRFAPENVDDQSGVGVFFSAALRASATTSLIADYTGQDLNLGLSFAPFRTLPITISPALVDVLGMAGDGMRMTLGIGMSYSGRRPSAAPTGDVGVAVAVPVAAEAPRRVVDSDADGVPDEADACANTPAGTPVDSRGCPLPPPDDDNDGVPNVSDACANTPVGTAVDSRGCPLPPPDDDKDGVPNAKDACPATPAGAVVNETGCVPPPPDADRDGVPDASDKCPATAAGTAVNPLGCAAVFAATRALVLEGVAFPSGSSVLGPNSRAKLDAIAAQLADEPTLRVEVGGHTDNTGQAAGNLRISQARAAAVRTYLISKGIAADRLTAKGYGSSKPLAPNTTPANRTKNRRVELTPLP